MNITRVFAMSENVEGCFAGQLTTLIKLEVGHIHKIKGRDFVVKRISKNTFGEPLADLELINLNR